MQKDLIKEIDNLLPQTQCGLCEYKDCLHYAKALADDEVTIDKCLPGGIEVLHSLADLLQVDPVPYLKEMEAIVDADRLLCSYKMSSLKLEQMLYCRLLAALKHDVQVAE